MNTRHLSAIEAVGKARMLPGRARLCVLSKLLHPTASQPTTTPATSAARDADYLLDDNYLFGQNMTEHNPAPSRSGHPLLSGPPTLSDIHQYSPYGGTSSSVKSALFWPARPKATRANDGHTMSTAGVPSRPQSSALQLSGLRTLATTWSKLPSRLSLHSLHARMP